MKEPDWKGARCAETDPELWFPAAGDPGRAARALCRACPLMQECLEWALYSGQEHGIWGGESPRARPEIRRRRNRELQARSRRWAQTDRRASIIAGLDEAGWSLTGIAAHLGISDRTVSRYRQRLTKAA